MLLVSTDRLTPGVAVALPVPHPQRADTCLIQADVTLTEQLVKRLKELDLKSIWVKHGLLNDLAGRVNTVIPERRRHIYNTIARGFDELQDRAITTADHGHYLDVIGELVTSLLEENSRVGVLAERMFNDGDELAGHCANVAFLAVTVGMHLESYILRQRGVRKGAGVRELCHLGVGAMLHDIGKLSLPAAHRRAHASADEHPPGYRDHVTEGFQMLRNRVNVLAGAIALHHHQRWDGAGWPDMTALTHGRFNGGMAAGEIHIFARIVAAANLFDQLTAGGEEPMPAVYALHAMQSERFAGAFDPVVLGAFLRYIPAFPIGAEVILSDGRAAAVVDLHIEHPCRPVVRPLDGGGDLDLLTLPKLHIRQSQGRRVDRWLYDPPGLIQALQEAGT